MKVNRIELANLLTALLPAVGAKENDLQQTCFVFQGTEAHAFNDEICISGPVENDCDFGHFAVQAKEFQALINKLKTDEIDIELKEDCLQIVSKRAKAEIAIEMDIKMPLDEIQFPEKLSPLPDDFSKALGLVLPAIGKDATQPLSTAVKLDGAFVEACDGNKAARYTLDKKPFKEIIYIPQKAAALASRLGVEAFAITEGWIHFSFNEKYVLSCRTKFRGQAGADLSGLLESKGTTLTLPEGIPDAIERAGLFTDSADGTEITHENRYAQVEIADNWIHIKGQGAIGKYEEKLRTEYEGKRIGFHIKADMLLAAVANNQKCEICDRFVKLFDKKFTYIVAFGIMESEND